MTDFERVGSGYDPGAVGYELQGRALASSLTLILPYYENPAMLAHQIGVWAAWPAKFKRRVEIVIVDDGSPQPAIDVERPEGLPALRIYRVLEDRPWHQHAARNLGANEAKPGWMLLTDMDHVLSEDALRGLFKRMDKDRLNPEAIYMLDRVEADTGLPTLGRTDRPKPHPNSFVVTKETFWRIGGYDEEYRGYGTDGKFKERAFSRAIKGHLTGIALTRYWRDLIPDASTTSFGRKESEWQCDTQAVTRRKVAEGRSDEVLTLDFPWERVL